MLVMYSIRIFLLLLIISLTSCSSTTDKQYYNLGKTPPPTREIKDVRVALALGGGGSRGIVHLGVISVLEENNIPIDLIVGTSAGSMIGAMYADYQDSKLLYDQLIGLKKWDLLDLSLADSFYFFSELRGPVQGAYLEDFVAKNITKNHIEDFSIPFVAVATDLKTSKAYLFSSGPVALGVHASSAIPPVFTPVHAYGKLLVDGGVVEPVPVKTARSFNPQVVVAVDISTAGHDYELNNMLDVAGKSFSIAYHKLSHSQSKKADILIHPDLEGFGTFDDDKNEILFAIGREAAKEKLPQILATLKSRSIIH